MDKKSINVLIAEDNLEKCEIMSEFLTSKLINVCGIAHDGYEVIKVTNETQPDILLLDIMMPNLDGIGVLRSLKLNPPPKIPKVIVISYLSQDFVLQESIKLGADYYFIRPLNMDSLYEMILLVSEQKNSSLNPKLENNLTEIIRKKVISLGVPTNVVGYKYIIESIKIIFEENRVPNLLKNIYKKIANENLTTSQCVESAIRNAIKQTSKTSTEEYKKIFPGSIYKNKRPSNLKFLTHVVESTKIENRL